MTFATYELLDLAVLRTFPLFGCNLDRCQAVDWHESWYRAFGWETPRGEVGWDHGGSQRPWVSNFLNDFTWPTAKSKMILTVTGFDKEGWAFYELCKAFIQFLCSWSTTCLPTSYINLLDAHEDSSSLAVLHPWPRKPQWGKSFGRGTWHRKLDLWVGARGRWTTHRNIK